MVLLREHKKQLLKKLNMQKKAGITQEQLAVKLRTKKSALSRIENHADDIRLSTLKNYLQALDRKLHINIL